ncbi:hypothetical protein [Pseudonocardia sp. DLS-67]
MRSGTDRVFTTVRFAAVAICAATAAGLVWLAVRTVVTAGHLVAATPGLVMLAATLGAVVALARSGLVAGAGPSSAKAAAAAKRGEMLAAALAGIAVAAGLLTGVTGGVVSGTAIGLAAVAFFALSRTFHGAAAVLERSAPPALPAPGTAVLAKPADIERAAASRPYPYPSPLPAAVKSAHRDAVVAHGFRATAWGMLIVLPGMPLVVISLFWGLGRHGSAADGLWSTAPLVAAGLLAGGLLCLAIAVPPTVRHAKIVSRHRRLLTAYGIEVNAQGVEIPPRQR